MNKGGVHKSDRDAEGQSHHGEGRKADRGEKKCRFRKFDDRGEYPVHKWQEQESSLDNAAEEKKSF